VTETVIVAQDLFVVMTTVDNFILEHNVVLTAVLEILEW